MKKLVIIALFLALVCGAAGWLWGKAAINHAHWSQSSVHVDTTPPRRDPKQESYAAAAKGVAPCVVNVFSTKVSSLRPESALRTSDSPFLRQFFGSESTLPAHAELNVGSGIIVSADGYILTNDHLVGGAEQIRVSVADGKSQTYTAKMVGRDSLTDLAVLKIKADHLPVITFGNSDQLKAGDVVLAVGNPFSLSQTVTMGIISAVKREGLSRDDFEDSIQTDAAINPGNSGGALVDVAGRLVGINTAILSGSGANQGIGFAIPSNVAFKIMQRLMEKGKIVRGDLGAAVQSITPDLTEALKVKSGTTGALVCEVTSGGPADKAGLKSGDVIIGFGGEPIKDGRTLQRLVANKAPKSKAKLEVLRGGKTMPFTATLQEYSSSEPTATTTAPLPPRKQGLDGLNVKDLDGFLRERLRIPDRVHGALVIGVPINSAAYDSGLRPGDVIEGIGHGSVTNATQVETEASHVHGQPTLVLVWNEDGAHFVALGSK
jgi:serine protease Do